ncbi:MAG: ABC transporter substrate-binding protein, partial [Myxococcales bacterium]|nr:ABC transporter substrate-binding protein [Myxococcales bacterium]
RIGGRLHLATTTPLSVLDPALAYHGDARTIGDLVYATLLTWNHDGELVPDLAARLERAEDGKRFTVTLRDGLVFHDGSPLRAADVKRSLERTLHPQSPCPGAQLYQGIVGAAAFAADPTAGLAGVVVEDERRVTFRLAEPDASFPALLGLGFAAPVCASAGAIADPKASAPPCGAGPFRIERFVRGEQLSLRRQASPGPEGPFVDAIDFTFDMPARTQRYRFERGELDFLLDLTGIDAQRYAADARWAPYLAWSRQPITHSIFLNTSIPPFSDVHLRRAVAFGVDPAVLSEVRPDVVEATRLMPPSLPGPRDRAPMRRHDPAAALEEMARAGFAFDPATGRGGYPEPIDYLTVPDSFEQAAAEIFQQQLAAIGLRLRLRLLSFSAYLGTISTPGAARMGWRGWAADYPDPATFFEPLLTSEGLEPGTQNVSFFRSPAMDGLLAQAHHTLDPEARFALYERAEAMLAAEAPLVPVYGSRALEVHQPWVRGYAPHPVLGARLRAVWLDAEGRP